MSATVTVSQIAQWVRGRVVGDPNRAVRAARTLAAAGPDDVCFADHAKHRPEVEASAAAAYVAAEDFALPGKSAILVADPLAAFVHIFGRLNDLRPPSTPPGVHPTAVIDPTATVDPSAHVGPRVVVGPGTTVGPRCVLHAGAVVGADCVLGADSVIHPNAVLYERTRLGERVIVHANATVGADGYGYRFEGGRHVRIPQQGGVEIGDDVEIGANSCVDRGTFGPTVVGPGTKIDNLVQIGHNTRVGSHVLLCAQVGIAGSATVGDYAAMGGQAGVGDHLTVGAGAQLAGQSGAFHSVPDGAKLIGTPGVPMRDWARALVNVRKLPELFAAVKRLQEQADSPRLREAS